MCILYAENQNASNWFGLEMHAQKLITLILKHIFCLDIGADAESEQIDSTSTLPSTYQPPA